MSLLSVLGTHIIAKEEHKSPFFFSRFNFDRMKERGNTHYCFHCGGSWGFRPGKNGVPYNCKDTKATLYKPNGEAIEEREALGDVGLESLLTNEPGYERLKPSDSRYGERLHDDAHFIFCPKLVVLATERRYKIFCYNPMERHDCKTHAEAVIGGAEKYRDVWTWLRQSPRPKDFPYIVNIPQLD